MKKSQLQTFIGKYYLNGIAESVKIDSTGDNLSCSFVSDDKNLVGNVKAKAALEQAELGVYQTSALGKLLTALDDDIDIKVDKMTDSEAVSLTITDKTTSVKFMLANLSIIQQPPTLKELPEYDITIDVNDDLINKFIKAKNALPEASIFAVTSNDNNVQFTLNFSSTPTNRIAFDVSPTTNTPGIDATLFNANTFKEILTANKGCTGTIKISSRGLMEIMFKDPDFESNYFLVKQTIN